MSSSVDSEESFHQVYLRSHLGLVLDGHDENDIVRVASARAYLNIGTEKLNRLKINPPGNKECGVLISAAAPSGLMNPNDLRLHEHEKLLLPDVKRFAETLTTLSASDLKIHISICHMEFGREVWTAISPALGTAPLEMLMVKDNDLGREGT